MSNDLDLYSNGGQIVPVSPGTDLAPLSPSQDWGRTDVDYLDDRHERAFGQLDPQIEANVAAIAEVFTTDMASLGFVMADISKCVAWFKQNLINPPTRMPQKKHNYETWQFSHDIAFQAFCNYAATQRFPQELIQSVAYWLQQLDDFQHHAGRFANNAASRAPAQGSATSIEDQLNDAEYARVQAINDQAAARAEAVLRDTWGSSFAGNMHVLRQHWDKLSTQEQEVLGSYTEGFVKGTNQPEILLRLFADAIGSGSIPRDSVSIAREIASHENLMRTDRKRWMADTALQARYRTLLNMRDGGR